MTFPLLYTSFNNQMCNEMSFVRKICCIQAYRGRVNNCWQRRKVRGAAHSSFHIFRRIKEMIMSYDSLLFLKKNYLDIINYCFWNSPSKQVNPFDYTLYKSLIILAEPQCSYFFFQILGSFVLILFFWQL